jgi:uncharacterized protein (DUF2147 family)
MMWLADDILLARLLAEHQKHLILKERYMRVRTGFILATTATATFAVMAQAAPAAISGRWVTKEKDAVIEIAPCGAAMCGRIAKYLKTPPNGVDQKDINNPDKALRTRKILGISVLQNLKPVDKEWKGTIYDPRNGKSYRSVVFLAKNGTLTVKGCLGPICQSQIWTKSNQ